MKSGWNWELNILTFEILCWGRSVADWDVISVWKIEVLWVRGNLLPSPTDKALVRGNKNPPKPHTLPFLIENSALVYETCWATFKWMGMIFSYFSSLCQISLKFLFGYYSKSSILCLHCPEDDSHGGTLEKMALFCTAPVCRTPPSISKTWQ